MVSNKLYPMMKVYYSGFVHRIAFSVSRLILFVMLVGLHTASFAQHPLRVVVAGLNHDHIHGVLNAFNNRNVIITGIAEPNRRLWEKYGRQYHLPDSLFFDDLQKVLQVQKPDAVLGYNEVAGHLKIVQICAPLGIPVMVEKPLAATLQQAQQMEQLANKHNINVSSGSKRIKDGRFPVEG